MNHRDSFDVDAWAASGSDTAPIATRIGICSWSDRFYIRLANNSNEINITAVLWLTVALCGLNIICLIIFYVDRCG